MAAKKKTAKPTGADVFSSSDRFERLTRANIADLMNVTLVEESFKALTDTDVRLTDEVCYEFVNSYANNGSSEESTREVLVAFGTRHFDV